MTKTVLIDPELMQQVEVAFFEYNASKDIIAFLMSRKETQEDQLQKYLDVSEKRFANLEIIKRKILKLYGFSSYNNYNFNFDTLELTVDIKEENE